MATCDTLGINTQQLPSGRLLAEVILIMSPSQLPLPVTPAQPKNLPCRPFRSLHPDLSQITFKNNCEVQALNERKCSHFGEDQRGGNSQVICCLSSGVLPFFRSAR
ncbi:hypothetical protein Bpfe_012324 [Biomphalaria pfeifferi]|uniref:Uncharacterized protein n=1 Tax=Biomphalaria pfeifferi TaxID=112525 RepID=A0AAD8FC08_BIOPF|nr:hypothetical protein Bpfe_012324 [Biomphalaria pfeifferi]